MRGQQQEISSCLGEKGTPKTHVEPRTGDVIGHGGLGGTGGNVLEPLETLSHRPGASVANFADREVGAVLRLFPMP